MNCRALPLLALVLACACASEPRPKMEFPEGVLSRARPAESARPGAPLVPPSLPVLLGEPIADAQALAAVAGKQPAPGGDAAYVVLALPGAPPTSLTGLILGPAQLKGVPNRRASGPWLTRCAEDGTLVAVTVPGVAPGFQLGVLVLPAELGAATTEALPTQVESRGRVAAKRYAERREAHLAWARAVDADADREPEVLVGLSRPGMHSGACGSPVLLERALVDGNGERLSAIEIEECLDEQLGLHCTESNDPTHCSADGLDVSGFAALGPVPLAAAAIRGGGVVLVEEIRTAEGRTRFARLLREAQVLELGEVSFPTGSGAERPCP